jgi:hypothetical protein
MEKFLSIPVLDGNGTNSQFQLVSISGLRHIGQASTTTVVLHYLGGKTVTLTYPVATASPILLESVQTSVKDALGTGWTNVVEQHIPHGAIVPAFIPPATKLVIINPLSAIAIA